MFSTVKLPYTRTYAHFLHERVMSSASCAVWIATRVIVIRTEYLRRRPQRAALRIQGTPVVRKKIVSRTRVLLYCFVPPHRGISTKTPERYQRWPTVGFFQIYSKFSWMLQNHVLCINHYNNYVFVEFNDLTCEFGLRHSYYAFIFERSNTQVALRIVYRRLIELD